MNSQSETAIMAESNPAYEYIKTAGIVTQEKNAYEVVQNDTQGQLN